MRLECSTAQYVTAIQPNAVAKDMLHMVDLDKHIEDQQEKSIDALRLAGLLLSTQEGQRWDASVLHRRHSQNAKWMKQHIYRHTK